MSQQDTQNTSFEDFFTAKDKAMDEIKEGNITFGNCDLINSDNIKDVPKKDLYTFVQSYIPYGLASIYHKLFNSLQYNKWVMDNKDKPIEEKKQALLEAVIAIQKIKKTSEYSKLEDKESYNSGMKRINNSWKVKRRIKGKVVETPDWLEEEKKPKKK